MNPDINPGAKDIPDDSIDQDCNELDAKTCFFDKDQDGYGTNNGTTVIAIDGSKVQGSDLHNSLKSKDPTMIKGV